MALYLTYPEALPIIESNVVVIWCMSDLYITKEERKAMARTGDFPLAARRRHGNSGGFLHAARGRSSSA